MGNRSSAKVITHVLEYLRSA